jgi:hypothetical protein
MLGATLASLGQHGFEVDSGIRRYRARFCINEARNECGIKQESLTAHSLLSLRLGMPYR